MKVTDKYYEVFNDLDREFPHSHFRDTAGNILLAVRGYAQFIVEDGVTSEDRRGFLKSLREVRTYFKLMACYSEFAEGELTSEGAFPDLMKFAESEEGRKIGNEKGFGGPYGYYIYLCKQRLEEIAKNG